MTSLSRVPPGRAGRLWLRRRLATAERGLELLDRKLRILRAEHDRLVLQATRTGEEWTAAYAEARTWGLRACLLSGRAALRPADPAGVAVTWKYAMGTGYPDHATCVPGIPPDALDGSTALRRAREAHRSALEAAARHAAAQEAERILGREVTATGQRIRALRDRWIPALHRSITDIELALDEMERSDAARLLRAASGRTARDDGPR